MSSGARAPYLRAGSLRSDTPASAGTCRIEVDQAEGFIRAKDRNRLRQVQRPRLSHERQAGGMIFNRRRLIRIPVRAGCPAAERGVTANAGLTSPCRA